MKKVNAKRKPSPKGPLRSEKELRTLLERIEQDDCLYDAVATIEINAPLALHQVELNAKRKILRWVLGEE